MKRSLLVAPLVVAAAAFVLTSEPRLISYEPLSESESDAWCDWDSTGGSIVASAFRSDVASALRRTANTDVASALRRTASFQTRAAGVNPVCAAEGCASVTARKPLRFVQDPYAEFSAVFVDNARNEVVLADENRFHVLFYDRLTNTPASAPQSQPKRSIGGLETETEYISGLYVDPKSGDVYTANNDTVHNMTVFSRKAEGDVAPDRMLINPYGSFGLAVDEEKQEVFVSVQHDGAVMVFPKMAGGNTPPIRLLQGDRTHLGDPHGISFDSKNKLIYVVNYGTTRQAVPGSLGPDQSSTVPRILNWPAGNLMPYNYRHEVVYGTGRFGAPSIAVFAADARGNTAPLRVIEGLRTQLNWPTGVAVDPDHGEVFVANDIGDSIAVFSATAQGDVAPIRVIKGSRAMLKNPFGVFVDVANAELWVANYGNHMATVYKRDASGDTSPIRVIRSAPVDAPASELSNPFGVAYDTRREEILAPNCVGHPRIGVFARTADKNALPVRTIEGQNTHLNRTVHSIGYDEIHDEMVVQSNIGQAILTFRGGANGNEAPIRVIQGPKTLLRDPEKVTLDPMHDEIVVFNMSVHDSVVVFDRLAQGDVPPKRILKGPDTLLGAGTGAVDPVHNLLIVNGNRGILIFDRLAHGNTKPLRVIGGPKSGLRGGGLTTVYPPTGKILASVMGPGAGGEAGQASDGAYVGIWNIEDNGDVPPQWTIGGPKGVLRRPHGVTVNAKEKTVIMTDKYVNAVLTYSLPEMFETNRSQQSASVR